MDHQLSLRQIIVKQDWKQSLLTKTSQVWSSPGFCPIIFLVYIADLQLRDSSSANKLLKFIDHSKVLTRTESEEDVIKLQNVLVSVYEQASTNQMKWNNLKFIVYFSTEFQEIVESNDVIRNMAKMIDLNISHDDQLSSAINKTKKKAARVLTNFSTWKVDFLYVMQRSLIQCHQDYGCLFWALHNCKKFKVMESILRAFTKVGTRQSNLDYW